MSLASRPNDDSLPPDDLARVIAVCDRFEADLNAGRPRRIEDELAAVVGESSRTRLFRELLALDIELARRAGRPAEPDSYLARFPDRAEAVRDVFDGLKDTEPDPQATATVGAGQNPAAMAAGYELIRMLGKGGQATTYLARDRALQRLVVLKRYHEVASSGAP